MSGSGFGVDSAPLTDFGRHLDELTDNLKGTAEVVGGCVGDIGIFGLVGQIFGAGVTLWCGKARDQLNQYSGTITEFADNVRDAAKAYDERDEETAAGLLGFKA